MVAATKKRRGRPRSVIGILAAEMPDMEHRKAMNVLYAAHAINTLTDRDPFFVTQHGDIRRQGIAEQIGRMIEDESITEDEARELIARCKEEYANGARVKEIEQTLRSLHQMMR